MPVEHRKSLGRIAWLLTATALLAACSGIPLKQREQAERDRFEAYAGQPVDHFTWLTHYDGWEPIGPHELVIWTGINDAYLIKVASPCDDLMFANHVALTNTTGTVYARFDFVNVRGWHCPIQEIRPIDYRRLRQDMRQQAKEAKEAKEATSTPANSGT
jgi:hypothetical protein